LEVTESKLAEDVKVVLASLTRLRLKGFSLSIDDFGTGFSSMERLRRFPFTELKIDRAFVNGAGRRASAKAIFQSSVNLAKAMNMVAVAEVVEDNDDLELAISLGTDLIQGYFIARPMAAAELEGWYLGRGH
jgi:EAL domain-containing protein (putative c-di-GMP-specific phosphodiesterase class I)